MVSFKFSNQSGSVDISLLTDLVHGREGSFTIMDIQDRSEAEVELGLNMKQEVSDTGTLKDKADELSLLLERYDDDNIGGGTVRDSKPIIAWTGEFTEYVVDDGSIDTEMLATLSNEEFSAATGSLVEDTHYTVDNVPAGLTAALVFTSATEVTISLTGNAVAHTIYDSIEDMVVTFLDAAFATKEAVDVVDSEKDDISVTFTG